MFSFPIQYVHEKLMGLTFRISPDAFFQGMNVTANRMLETFDGSNFETFKYPMTFQKLKFR